MNEGITPRGQIRGLRRQHQWSQEDLAEAAARSVTTIKKAESGGHVRTDVLHDIAAALGVTTSDLYTNTAIAPQLGAEPDHHALARLRAVASPPIGLDGSPIVEPTDDDATPGDIVADVKRAETYYRADRYDDVADMLPRIIAQAHRAVGEHDTDEAYRARAKALQMAGRYLTQVRQLADALTALRASIQDAAHAGDRTLAAMAINGQGWALTRQGRMDECEQLCVATADEVEPRMSTATGDELAAWGSLLFRGAAAAVRNNRAERADEMMQMASAAASALGHEHESWATFGPLTVAHKQAEFALIKDQPDRTLQQAERLPDRRVVGDVTSINWERHRLDVAHALVKTRDAEQATNVMSSMLRRSPEWLRRQSEAYNIVTDILQTRPKRPTKEMVKLASHLGVVA
ncbi:DNA-binding XRE family transcriptional regulator [Haloactinospora alba]|uniref:DNA-binding XRE family transcriptional regulator n=1 Tax=Haloactinospora alba TaxID=405555 RepID=A0A543NH43_9ACTN|nr:helix-turn-helix transcriptional regulator [Haloactinospora alba]TQN31152.1 DNA-binding XRE family transcriptional regulator [Haloactinospora alba]